MEGTQILRLRRTDGMGHLLINVTPIGLNPLKLKLIGTEHEHLYHGEITEANLKQLQSSKFSGNLEEWRSILQYVLLQQRQSSTEDSTINGLECIAAITDKTMTITVRRNIEGITQRLGAIKLKQDDEREAVSPFDWVERAVANSDKIRRQLEELQASMSTQRDQVVQLNAQLDELVRAKKEHEEELLSKFAALLNAKKARIRDQQRLIQRMQSDAKAGQRRDEEIHGSAELEPVPSTKPWRSGKRKADKTSPVDDDQGAEMPDQLADDDGGDSDSAGARQDETPSHTDHDTDFDDMEDLDGPAEDVDDQRRMGTEPESESRINWADETLEKAMDVDEAEELPRKRNLPFNVPRTRHSGAAEQLEDSGSDTDDEL